MECIGCGSAAVSERSECTAQGYRRFRCRACGKQFNERSAGSLNRTQYPSDVIALVVLWRLRYKLALRDLPEMFLIRGIVSATRRFATGKPSSRRRWLKICRDAARRAGVGTSTRPTSRSTGVTPDRVTTDGHDSYPRAIRTTLGAGVRHRDSQYLNNRLEQDHRGVKGRYGPMRGFKCPRSTGRFCRAYDELRNLLRSRPRTNQQVSANYRRFHFLRRTATVLSVLEAA